VNDALAVRGVEGVGNLDRECEQALLLHGAAIDQMFQRLSGQAFHHDEEVSVVLADLVNRADVGMVQG